MLEEKWILAIAPKLERANVVPPASALIASVQPARRAAAPAARLVAVSAPLAACARAIPAAPAAVSEELNVMLQHCERVRLCCASSFLHRMNVVFVQDNK